jgi:hypothetical protein
LDKAVLSICAARICRLVLAEAVHLEVQEALARIAARLSARDGADLMEVYRQFPRSSDPERHPLPAPEVVRINRHLIRHQADVAVLVSALEARPDWVLTNNTKRFTREVERKTRLRIGTPAEFFGSLIDSSQ